MEASSAKIKKKKKKNSRWKWYVTIICLTILISASFSFASNTLLANSGMLVAFSLLFVIVLIGVLFDMVGIAVASADEKPFHAMAARKVPGASNAIWLLRNADKVSSFCNDVVGDICGIVSGAASAVIASQLVVNFDGSMESIIPLAMSAMVAGFTIGGKAAGKSMAMNRCTDIVFLTARCLAVFQRKNRRKRK